MVSREPLDERQVVRAFYASPKRQRLLTTLDDRLYGRGELTSGLWLGDGLDERWLTPIPRREQRVDLIESRLKDQGAWPDCWVISVDDDIDERWLPLQVALERVVGSGNAALLVCKPYVLAYHEGEAQHDRSILRRPA
jgi:hypothetical protein